MTVNELVNNLYKKSAKAVVLSVATGIIFSLGGCSIFGGGDDKVAKIEAAEEVFQIGVNAYLWRASLSTLDFMPILSADHEGGLILSDWKLNPSDSNERTKVDVRIVGRKLSADSLDVTVHRQAKSATGWVDVAPRPGASINIRNAILMQAKLLRRDNAPIK